MLDKLRLYDGQAVPHFSQEDVGVMTRHHPDEGMSGISPRYVMNRLSAVASSPDVACISPLKALDSLWQGMRENAGVDAADLARYIGYVKDTLEEYGQRAIQEVQRAFEERFKQTASELLTGLPDQRLDIFAAAHQDGSQAATPSTWPTSAECVRWRSTSGLPRRSGPRSDGRSTSTSRTWSVEDSPLIMPRSRA